MPGTVQAPGHKLSLPSNPVEDGRGQAGLAWGVGVLTATPQDTDPTGRRNRSPKSWSKSRGPLQVPPPPI